MSSSSRPSSSASSSLSDLGVNHFEKLSQEEKNIIYSHVLTGVWTGQSPALIQALRGTFQHVPALKVMARVHEFVLSPRNNYEISRMPKEALGLIRKVRVEFKLIQPPPRQNLTTFTIFPSGNGQRDFSKILLAFANLTHLTLDMSFIPPDERAWYTLLGIFMPSYPHLRQLTLIRDLNTIYRLKSHIVTATPIPYSAREPAYAPPSHFNPIHDFIPRGEINRLSEISPDNLLIERMNRILGYNAVLDKVNYTDREIWSWTFVPEIYEGEDGLVWVDSLIDRSGAWDAGVWWEPGKSVRDRFVINHFTRMMSGMSFGRVYWIKEGELEYVARRYLKVLRVEEMEELLLGPRDERGEELRKMVETVPERKKVPVVKEKEEVVVVGRKKRKEKGYLESMGGNAMELDWATGVD